MGLHYTVLGRVFGLAAALSTKIHLYSDGMIVAPLLLRKCILHTRWPVGGLLEQYNRYRECKGESYVPYKEKSDFAGYCLGAELFSGRILG